MTNSYATLNQMKSSGWLNISASTFDADLLRLLTSISREIDKYTNRWFYCLEGTRYYDGSGQTLFFKDDLLSINASGFKLDTGDKTYSTTLATTDYDLYPLNIYPKIFTKASNNGQYGNFANGIRAGVKITGVFGYGDGDSATPYTDSTATVNTGNMTIGATTHALATGKGALFSAGMTIRIGLEQFYISSITTDTLTFTRATNGTVAAAHTSGDIIYIYQYPGPITEATLIQASKIWKRKDTAFQTTEGNAFTGQILTFKGFDPDAKDLLSNYVKRRF